MYRASRSYLALLHELPPSAIQVLNAFSRSSLTAIFNVQTSPLVPFVRKPREKESEARITEAESISSVAELNSYRTPSDNIFSIVLPSLARETFTAPSSMQKNGVLSCLKPQQQVCSEQR
ncbi:uncharacterized protein UTRI_01974 [Ustilago trichophora]|uniref:Uncharacterized protein n=1 Tax=Ustilago trichophora TaxID=86804 RepID=A0A5C3E1B9_9BASI|nr:uncharacterized protein UTRI_01974 [Ustilago trichophora]